MHRIQMDAGRKSNALVKFLFYLFEYYLTIGATKCNQIGSVTRAVYSRISHRATHSPPPCDSL